MDPPALLRELIRWLDKNGHITHDSAWVIVTPLGSTTRLNPWQMSSTAYMITERF